MKLKRYLHLALFLGLLLFLPALLYMVEIINPDFIMHAIEGDGGLPGEHDLERTNYYTLVYRYNKDKLVFSIKHPSEELDAEKAPDLKTQLSESECDNSIPVIRQQVETQPDKPSASNQVASGTTVSSSSLSAKEQEMLNLVNQARSNAGLSQLQVCSELTRAARAKSKDMIDNNYFSHTSPRYGGLEGLLRNFGISYRSAGENLAMNSSGSVSAAHNSLMNSPGHRDNILGSSYRFVGIGIHVKSDGSHYYTQLFVGR